LHRSKRAFLVRLRKKLMRAPEHLRLPQSIWQGSERLLQDISTRMLRVLPMRKLDMSHASTTGLQRPPGGKPMNNAELAERLCDVSAPLREACRMHVTSFGTLIPHVFMGTVLARVGLCLVQDYPHPIPHRHDELEGIFAAIEQGMTTGDRETRNVVALSFVKDSEGEIFFGELKQWLGPAASRQVNGI
jgi:hypothetical protein